MGMFDFLLMDSYENRVVGRFDGKYKGKPVMVSTAYVNDAEKPYETAVQHPAYHSKAKQMTIVETYDTKEEAATGHDKWTKIMTAKKLPDTLKDRGLSGVSEFGKAICGGSVFDVKKV